MALLDPFGRKINYLRLSVTDRCNLRCLYCVPGKKPAAAARGEILGYDDLERVARAAVSLGVEKIRVTGGEPLSRRGIVGFLGRLAAIPGLKRLVVTTNGVLLPAMARNLRGAGVESVNISLDSLRADVFSRITGGGSLRSVLHGIAAAEDAGFPYIKINVVVIRGVNESEAADFAALSLAKPYRVRFIEYMPTAGGAGWRSAVVPGDEILEDLSRRYDLRPVPRDALTGPAREFRIAGAAGTIGIITPISCHFCAQCNRIRVTARGLAKGCLFGLSGIDLRPFLGNAHDVAGLRDALRRIVCDKPKRHGLSEEGAGCDPFPMSEVGG